MKILITGGKGFIANEIYNKLKNKYYIYNPGREELNLLDKNNIKKYFESNIIYDLVIHTAIKGGNQSQNDSINIFYDNLKMFYNLLEYKNKFLKLINFSSGAIYNRNFDINGENNLITSNPDDYYGFSKNIIDRLILNIDNFYNIRIFNVFSKNEKESRFIKTCINNIEKKKNIIIDNDRYFDFFYIDDLIKVIEYYLNNNNLIKDIDLCYNKKYKLSEIAKIIINENNNIKIEINSVSNLNYIGNYKNLYTYNINFIHFEQILKKFI
jgi:GDP-L-fucose synthase